MPTPALVAMSRTGASTPDATNTAAARSSATLRVVAEQVDLWNCPGGDLAVAVQRGALLGRYCAEIGSDPASITRSIHVPVSYDKPELTRSAVDAAIDAGFRHIILSVSAPYPADVVPRVADEIVGVIVGK